MSAAEIFAGLLLGGYRVIYADPPWHWIAWSKKGTGRGAISHYDVVDFDTLAALPVADLAARDCVLLLWVSNPCLQRGLALLQAWGFRYSTVGSCWVKPNRAKPGWQLGLGYWSRSNAELCLLGVRGSPKRLRRDVRQLIVAPRREHSRKPAECCERIEALLPGPRCELFSRSSRPGWDSWGAQKGLFDAGPVKTRRQPSEVGEARP